jgi:hypothetical protein
VLNGESAAKVEGCASEPRERRFVGSSGGKNVWKVLKKKKQKQRSHKKILAAF